MKGNTKLESGKRYSLSQLFSEAFTISIPDLQRDYCWGMDTYDKNGHRQGELVSGFLNSLRSKFLEAGRNEDNEVTPMGLIYGYEWPKHVYQLCDGQQRITTFYLLAGVLYRSGRVSEAIKVRLGKVLVKSNSCLNRVNEESVESSLKYSIRETTLYFLSDLVSHYFIQADCELSFVKKDDRKSEPVLKRSGRPAWYFMEYDNDPTIQSMLGAIATIREFLSESFGENESLSNFAEAILDDFTFIYYDMGNRLRGEETFVVLNTTGEPLTATENLKPILLGGLSLSDISDKELETLSDQWERREDWFWKHRTDKEATSDNFSKDFYSWYLIAHADKDNVDLIRDFNKTQDIKDTIMGVHRFYQSMISVLAYIDSSKECKYILKEVSKWTENLIDETDDNGIINWLRSTSRQEVFIPLILFHEKFHQQEHYNSTDTFHMLRRLTKNHYFGWLKININSGDDRRPYLKNREILNIVKNASCVEDVLQSPRWYNLDEQRKETIFKNQPSQLLAFELDDLLRFDLNVIWETNVTSITEAQAVLKNIHTLCELGEGLVKEHTTPSMANQYRVLKFLKGWGADVGKQWQVNWKQWGVMFSTEDYSKALSKNYPHSDMLQLLKADDLKSALCSMLQETIRTVGTVEEILTLSANSQPYEIMRAWLISKMLINEYVIPSPKLISSYSDYPLCVNQVEKSKNLISKDSSFSAGNLCLHHVNRNGPWTVQKEYFDSSSLDTPLFVGIKAIDYNSFTEGRLSKTEIESIENSLKGYLEKFLLS